MKLLIVSILVLSPIIPALFPHYSREISSLLFPKLSRHIRRRPSAAGGATVKCTPYLSALRAEIDCIKTHRLSYHYAASEAHYIVHNCRLLCTGDEGSNMSSLSM